MSTIHIVEEIKKKTKIIVIVSLKAYNWIEPRLELTVPRFYIRSEHISLQQVPQSLTFMFDKGPLGTKYQQK